MYLSWLTLKELIAKPRDLKAKELAEAMTMAIVEVEGYVSEAEKWSQMVVGKVEAIKLHPNASKLKLALVDLGEEKLEVICGGVNLKEKMLIAFAYPGAKIRWHGQGDWQILQVATIRGVESKGMICSAAEIGLVDPSEPEQGIMDLSYLKTKPGTSLAQALGKDDLILEIDNKSITHRPDLWGHLGLARELAALWKTPHVLPKLSDVKPDGDKVTDLKISIKDPDLCQRYLGVIVDKVKIESSPQWLKNRVEALGMRSINNVVDLANYVMLEIGQPLHTFDLTKLTSSHIIVRRVKRGETIVTLDDVERKLPHDTLVVADSKHAQAIAGIMGGKSSEIAPETTKLLIESATFESRSIRQSSLALGLRTEASIRFEKAQDPALAEIGIKRFVYLLKTLCPSVKIVSPLVDEYPIKSVPVSIEVSPAWLEERIGDKIKHEEIKKILENLGFEIWHKDKAIWVAKVPSWRATRDVTIPEDLIEEVARIYGYGNIKPVLPKFEIKPPFQDETQDLRWKIKEVLVSAGWTETLNYSFVDNNSLDKFGYGTEKTKTDCLELQNPVNESKKHLRPTLLLNLAEQVKQNFNFVEEIKLFEIGRVFINKPSEFPIKNQNEDKLPFQNYKLGLAIYIGSDRDNLGILKGVLEIITRTFGIKFVFKKSEDGLPAWTSIDQGAEIFMGKLKIGYLGESSGPSGLPSGTAMAEIDLDLLPRESVVSQYKSIPLYPSVIRDLTVALPNYPSESVNWFKIKEIVSAADKLIGAVDYIDYFSPKNALTFRLTFRSLERTLKTEEVDKIMESIKKILIKKFTAEIRDH